MVKSKASVAQKKKPAAKKATAKPRVKKNLVKTPSSLQDDITSPKGSTNADVVPEPGTLSSPSTIARPTELKNSSNSHDESLKHHSPSPKPVELSAVDENSSHGSSTPKAKSSDRFNDPSDTTGTIIDWRRVPSIHVSEEEGSAMGSGSRDVRSGHDQQIGVTGGNGMSRAQYCENRERKPDHPTADRPNISWVLKYPNPPHSDDSPYRHEKLRQESKGKGREVVEQPRYDGQPVMETASGRSATSSNTQMGSSGYEPMTTFGFAPYAAQQNLPGIANYGGNQSAFDPYERQVQQPYPYQYSEIARPSSTGFMTSADARSLPYYNSSTGAATEIASMAPLSAHTSKASTSSEFSHTHAYARSAPSAPQTQSSSYNASASTSGYQASVSAVSMTLPSVAESKPRSKSSTTPTPNSQRSQTHAAYSSREATTNIDPALMDYPHKTKRTITASATGNVMDLTAQQSQHSSRSAHQPPAQRVYAEIATVLTAPPSISAQIEHLVFHVSPLCPLEELDFAFYLACCWNGEPTMLKPTCALYQQWVSAGLQRTEDLVNYFLHAQQSVMSRLHYFRKIREGRLTFNPANRKCDNCFGTSPTLPLPTKDEPNFERVRLCKDCGNAMVTLHETGNYFHAYTVERRKLVAFHEAAIRENLREMGFPVEDNVEPMSR